MTPFHLLRSALTGAVLAWAGIGTAQACDHDDVDGPDVALVLSGGGALASTQVGALKVIEQLNVPIHCVVGTSMGSVVGGLYAAGYDAEEIENIFVFTDWAEVFSARPPREDQSYLQSERSEDYLTGYLVGIGDDGVRLPGGLRSMRGLRRHFRDLTFHVPLDADFDQLSVPYRAVVTDYATGDAAALDQGDLVQAMLASMAVPGAFPPREIDGRLYVDGGMASQLPVSTAQAMGADIIIAIDTTIEPPAPSSSPTVADTLQQLVRVTVWRNHQQEVARLGEQDLLITPDLSELSTTSFERANQGIASGQREAEIYRERLAQIAAVAAPMQRRPLARTRPEHLATHTVSVVNSTAIDDEVLTQRAAVAQALENSPEDLERRLNALTAFGAIGEADLALDASGLVLMVDERDIGRGLIQGGLRMSNNFEGDSTFSVLARYSRRPFSRHGGDFSLSVELGTNLGLDAVLQQPFGEAGRYFYEPSLFYRGEQTQLSLAELRLGDFWDQQAGARLRVGRELGDWGLIAVGAEVRRGRVEPKVTLIPGVEPAEYTLAGAGAILALDTLDHVSWPTRGVEVKAEAYRLFDVESEGSDTTQFMLRARTGFEAGQYGFIASTRAGLIENDNGTPVDLVGLGGFRQLSAYPQNSLPTDRYVYGSLEWFERLDRAGALINVPVYFGVLAEAAHLDLNFLGLDEIGGGNVYSGAIYLGADTILGPVMVSGAIGEGGAGGLFFNIGRSF